MSKIDRMQRLDRIKKAIDEETDVFLSEAERKEKVELLTVAGLLLNPWKTTQSIIQILKHEHGLGERQAFQRLTDAKFVFGNIFSPDRAIEKMKAYQRAELAWKMAHEQEYVDGMVKANDQMMKIVGADDPNDQFDPTRMEPSIYRAVLPASERKALTALLASGAVDLGQLLSKAGLLTDVEALPVAEEVADQEEQEDAAD